MGYADTPVPVSVDVTLLGADWVGQRSDSIRGSDPVLRFYEQAPLLGINFNKELPKKAVGSGNQFTIKAVPYFFSSEDVNEGVLLYTWRVNNSDVVPGLDPTILPIGKTGNDEAQQKAQQFAVSLKIQTPRHLLQQGFTATEVTLPEETQQ